MKKQSWEFYQNKIRAIVLLTNFQNISIYSTPDSPLKIQLLKL